MKIDLYTMLVIIGCAVVTQLEKGAPFWLLGGRKLNPVIEKWLSFVPAAVLTALLIPEVLMRKLPDGGYALFISPDNVFLLASAPAVFIAWKWNSFFGAIVAGMASVALLRYFGL
ncbi:branched-chain amino acid ABC transporter [Synergistales bacterium]|nr:branched-chain amino acid ABC transporter [Synergistales bacterium]